MYVEVFVSGMRFEVLKSPIFTCRTECASREVEEYILVSISAKSYAN